MKYRVETTKRFDKEMKKLGRYTVQMIKSWIDTNLDGCEDPRARGKALTANRSGQWRYRIGDYRILAEIHEEKIVIILLSVGHRSEVYR